MKEGDIISVALEVTVRYTEDNTGLIVGFFREFPFITGQAKTLNELVKQLQYDLGLYFNNFPEGNKILIKYGRIFENGKMLDVNINGEKAPQLEIKESKIDFEIKWQEEKIPICIPA